MGGMIGAMLDEFIGAIAAILVIIGVLECYFGYKIFKLQIAIVGFLLGVAVGIGVVGIKMSAGVGVGILVGVLIGVLFAYLSVKVYFLGVFLFVAALSGAAAFLLTGGEQPLLCIIVAIVIGVIGTMVARHLIIISTSLAGGVAAGMGLAKMAGMDTGFALLISALFAGTGLYVQYRTNARQPHKSKDFPQSEDANKRPGIKLPDISLPKSMPKFKVPESISRFKPPDIRWPGSSPRGGAVRAGGSFCPSCGRLLPHDAGFCNICGQKISGTAEQFTPPHKPYGEERPCPVCGKALPPDAGFCGGCGNTVPKA